MNKPTKKPFPEAPSELVEIFGLKTDESSQTAQATNSKPAPGNLPVADLPVAEKHEVKGKVKKEEKPKSLKKETTEALEVDENKSKAPLVVRAIKTILPYLIVFAVAIFLYYFFFSQVNFGNITNSAPKVEAKKKSPISSLVSQNLESYYAWVNGYYYEVSNPEILDPYFDNSGNGLSNFEKYLLKLNPKSFDTLNTGMADSEALSLGINPLTGGEMTDSQKEIVEEYINMEVVMNRLTLSQARRTGAVAGTGVVSSTGGLRSANHNYVSPSADPIASQDQIQIDTNIPGRVEVPSLDINVPIIWTQDPKDFEADLKRGVVHYPGTALPGQVGTAYVSGHSSNYAWAGGDFNRVFAKLGDLPLNTSVKVTVVQKNGRDAVLHYVVFDKREFLPTDQEQFRNSGKSVVALSTCWPINSTAKRLVVFAELTQISK